nr:hypothetical protein [Tanacetum cinerariifolium]
MFFFVVAALSEGSPDIPVVGASEQNADILGVGRTSTSARPVTQGAMSVAALASSSSMDKEILDSSSSGFKRKNFKDLGGRSSSPAFARKCIGDFGLLVTYEEDADYVPFLPGDGEACESHNILSGLDHLKFQRRLDGLSLVELDYFHDVFSLKLRREQSNSVATVARLKAELLCAKGEVDTIRSKCCMFEEKEAIMLATEGNLKTELEVLKEKLYLTNEDFSLMVTELLPHAMKTLLSSDSFISLLADLHKKAMLVSRPQPFEEVVGMDLGFHLEDVKDYDPDATKEYDKAINDFYHVEFPNLDLLAYHLKRILGLLKSLEPPFVPIHKSSGACPFLANVMSVSDEGVVSISITMISNRWKYQM